MSKRRYRPSDYQRMFSCDAVRISAAMGRLFLILGWKKRSAGEWFKNGEPFNFDYLEEQVVASGDTHAELLTSARQYKRLLQGTARRTRRRKRGGK